MMKERLKAWFAVYENKTGPLGVDLAKIIHAGLIAGICVSFLAILAALVLQPPNWSRLVTDAMLIVVMASTLRYFLRRGWVRWVTFGMVIGFWGLAVFTSFTGVGVRGTSYGLFILVVILAALFIHRRAAYLVAFLASLAGLGLLWANHSGLLPNANRPLSELASWLIQTAYFFVAAVVLDVALRQIDQALHQARHELEERTGTEAEVRRLNEELEQRIAERTAQLTASEERYRRITELSSDYVFSSEVTPDGKVTHTWVAGAFESIMGCSFEEYVASGGWLAFVHPEDLVRDTGDMAALYENRTVSTEIRIRTKTGEERWVSIYAYPVWNDTENRLGGIYGAVKDITARKQTEEALRQAEFRYRTLVEQTSAVIYRNSADLDATTLYISPQIVKLLGYPIEAWMNQSVQWRDLTHPEDRPRVEATLATYLQIGGNFTDEYRLQTKDGWWVWVRDEAVLVTDADGNPLFIQGVLIEITEQKLAQAQAHAVTQGLRAIMEITDELILIPDLDTFYRRAVELAREKLRLERCSLFLFDPTLTYQLGTYGTTDQGVTSDERFLKLNLETQVAKTMLARGERSILTVEGEFMAWDSVGHSRMVGKGWIATTLIQSSTQPIGVFSNDSAISGRPVNETQQDILLLYCSLLGNIIERKRIEEAMREAEFRYRTLVEQTSVVIYRDAPDLDGTSQYISPRIESLVGYTAEEWLSSPSIWKSLLHPDDQERAQADVRKYITNLSPYIGEYRLKARGGRWVWVRDEAVVVTDEEGKPRYVQGVLIDVTEQKQAETREQAITQGLRAVLEITDELILIPDLDTFYRRSVELAREKLGVERCGLFLFDPELKYQIGTYGTDELGQTTDERYAKMELEKSTAERVLHGENRRFWDVVTSQIAYWDQNQHQKILGEGWVAITILWSVNQPIGVLYNDAGISWSPVDEILQEILVIYCSLLGNIIERKRTEEALRNSEKRFRALVEQLPAITYSDDITQLGKTIYISPQVQNILGYSPDEWINGELNFWLNHIHPEDREQALAEFEACFQNGQPVNSEYRIFTRTGEIVWLQDRAIRLEDENGQPLLMQGVMTDITKIKEAEHRLAQNAARLAVLYQLSHEMVGALDLEQICAAVYRAVENLMPTDAFFISLVDESQNTMQDIYLFDDGRRWPNESISLNQPTLTTNVYRTGETLWIQDDADGTSERIGRQLFGSANDTRSVLIAPLKLGGRIVGLISAQHYQPYKYTTEHVQVLETLANQLAITIEHARLVQSLRLQAVALDAAANAIVITDQQGKIQWVNPAFTYLTGYSLEEVVNENPHILKSGAHDADFYKKLWETIRAGEVWHGEIINRRKDGSRYVEEMVITPVKNEYGEIFRFIAIKQDITARKQAEEQETRRRLLLEKVIELGKAVTKETDLRSCLRQIHQSVQKGLGFDRVGVFLYEEYTDLIRGVFGTSRTGEIEDTSWYSQKASESKAWLDALSHPLGMNFIHDFTATNLPSHQDEMAGVIEHISLAAWAGDKPVALIAADNLITQRMITPEERDAFQLFAGYAGLAIENARWNAELEARVAERTGELEAANQELQSFTYTIAHDLRAPARAMIGFSGLLDEYLTGQVELDPIAQNYLTRVHVGAKRMGQMIDELLEYTRLGRTSIRKQSVNMNILVDQALKKFQTQISQRNIELIRSELPASQGDPKWLEFVWEQLISNAIKFTRPQETPLIEIGSGLQDQVVFYFIRDNGIGFDMRYAHKLFGVFQRLQIEDEYEGTGMGLALSERIIEKHGGRIWAEAQLNQGAIIRFTLD